MPTPFKRTLSRVTGWLADRKIPTPLRAPIYRSYCRFTGADLEEVRPPLKAYPSLGAFFVRELVAGARAGVLARPSEAAMLSAVAGFMRSHSAPGESVAVMPYFPLAHFLADRVGPHPSAYIVWPFAEFEDRDRRIIDAMEEAGTRTVVYNFTQFRTFPRMREFAPELFAYLVDHFEMVRVFCTTPWDRPAAAGRSRVPTSTSTPRRHSRH